MITIGCDAGSLFCKAVVMDEDKLLGSNIMRTTGNAASEMEDFLGELITDAGLNKTDIDWIATTGCSADVVTQADFTEDEVSCVASAVGFYLPGVELAIQIGGQSIASLLLDSGGDLANFMRNDKCASGSGRFIEMMGTKLGVELSDIDDTVAGSKSPTSISGQCVVFAESEVITHVNNGEKTPDIFAGICDSLAAIVAAQGRRFGADRSFTLTGGVPKFDSIVQAVCRKLEGEYLPFPFDPQLAPAVGAALLDRPE